MFLGTVWFCMVVGSPASVDRISNNTVLSANMCVNTHGGILGRTFIFRAGDIAANTCRQREKTITYLAEKILTVERWRANADNM